MPSTPYRTIRRAPTTRGRRRPVYRRRRPITRRRKPTYRKRRATRRPTGSSYLQKRRWEVVRNPFSLSTTNPKIPDKRCTFSAGQRLQVADEVTQGALTTMTIVMYPGASNGLCIAKSAEKTTPVVAGDLVVPVYNNHVSLTKDGTTITEPDVEKWRMVSQGTRISLVTNTEENDGWFEYIRVPVDASSANWQIANKNIEGVTGSAGPPIVTAVAEDKDTQIVPSAAHISELTNHLIDHVTYQSGKLRDIHKYSFTLHKSGEDHEFRPIKQSYPLVFDAVGTKTSDLYDTYPIGTDLNMANTLLSDVLDTSFGMLVLVIHGTPNKTKLMYHQVANQEIIYDQASKLSRFHTRSNAI